jgi:hypothetical protein
MKLSCENELEKKKEKEEMQLLHDNEERKDGRRTFHHLIVEQESDGNNNHDDNDDTQANTNALLFAWEADQILARLLVANGSTATTTTTTTTNPVIPSKEDIVIAIQRVALNSFTVQSLLDTEVPLEDAETHLLDFDTFLPSVMQIGRPQPRGGWLVRK